MGNERDGHHTTFIKKNIDEIYRKSSGLKKRSKKIAKSAKIIPGIDRETHYCMQGHAKARDPTEEDVV